MKFYLIDSVLRDSSEEECLSSELPRVIVLTRKEWEETTDIIMPEVNRNRVPENIKNSRAESHFECMSGTFSVPDREKPSSAKKNFAFVVDPSGIVFVDDTSLVNTYLAKIKEDTQWNHPCLERFMYDFADQIIRKDTDVLEKYERQLGEIEKDILNEHNNDRLKRLSRIRSDLREMRIHYRQLLDVSQQLEENANGFFKGKNLRYFGMVGDRVTRLYELASSLKDYNNQLNDLFVAMTDQKQNRIMTALTVITAIFMPLTLIVGWYGMNFVYMPELQSPYGYPAVILGSLLIVVGGLYYFHRKKWL